MLVHDFDLSPEEALPVLQEWNERCQPPWTTRELKRKLEFADCCLEPDRGQKKRQRKNSLKIHIQPDDQNILVGVDCGNESASYVELSTMWAALVKVGRERELAPEMDKLDWQGKRVLLTPPSTVATNQQEVWAEFFLARLLRRKGAVVESLHVPDREGRRQTYAMARGEGELVEPPYHAWQVHARAREASQRARALDAHRRALPRRKGSPKRDKAVAFVREHGVHSLTADVLKRAKRRGISRSTLKRAIGEERTRGCAPENILREQSINTLLGCHA